MVPAVRAARQQGAFPVVAAANGPERVQKTVLLMMDDVAASRDRCQAVSPPHHRHDIRATLRRRDVMRCVFLDPRPAALRLRCHEECTDDCLATSVAQAGAIPSVKGRVAKALS